MKKALPTLDQAAWVTDGTTLGAKLLQNALRSAKGQSVDFDRSIVSIPSMVVLYGAKPSTMISELEFQINSLFSRYFDVVEVKTSVEDETDSRYTINLDVTYGDGKEVFSLGMSLFVSPKTKDILSTIENFGG